MMTTELLIVLMIVSLLSFVFSIANVINSILAWREANREWQEINAQLEKLAEELGIALDKDEDHV